MIKYNCSYFYLPDVLGITVTGTLSSCPLTRRTVSPRPASASVTTDTTTRVRSGQRLFTIRTIFTFRHSGLIWGGDGLANKNCCEQLSPVINTPRKCRACVINCCNLTMENIYFLLFALNNKLFYNI